MNIEQSLSFARVTDHRFGERLYQALSELFKIQEQLARAKEKVNTLAEHIRDSRASAYQRLLFWVTILFAPLTITTAFFSGIHMDREFQDRYYTFLPAQWQPSGWLLFLTYFAMISSFTGLLWLLLFLSDRRNARKKMHGKKFQ